MESAVADEPEGDDLNVRAFPCQGAAHRMNARGIGELCRAECDLREPHHT